jgi:hypothetical protein
MEIVPSSSSSESLDKVEASIVRMNVFKGKKSIFKDDILLIRKDTEGIRRYIRENLLLFRQLHKNNNYNTIEFALP